MELLVLKRRRVFTLKIEQKVENVWVQRKECVSDGLHPRQVGSGDAGVWGWESWKRLGLGPLLVCLRGLEMITDC